MMNWELGFGIMNWELGMCDKKIVFLIFFTW